WWVRGAGYEVGGRSATWYALPHTSHLVPAAYYLAPLAVGFRSCKTLLQFADPLDDRRRQLRNDGYRRVGVKLRLRHAVIAGGRSENVIGGGNYHELRGRVRSLERARVGLADLNVVSALNYQHWNFDFRDLRGRVVLHPALHEPAICRLQQRSEARVHISRILAAQVAGGRRVPFRDLGGWQLFGDLLS